MTTVEHPARAQEPPNPAATSISPLGHALREATAGRWGHIRERARQTLPVELMQRDPALTMPQARDWTRATLATLTERGFTTSGFPQAYGGHDDVGRSAVDFEMCAHGDLSVTIKSGVQFGLFGGAVASLGTQWHHETYLRDIVTLQLPGCYAMTEIGHGSDVSSLETTLTYDPAGDEIVVHSPTASSMKAYIGGAAVDARMGVVYGQLVVGEQHHGVHATLVPLRDETGRTLPGVMLGDHGAKGGLAGVDNGTLMFDHVRVPRRMLLDRYGGVTSDGEYVSEIENPNRRFFTMLGTLVRGRVCIAGAGGVAGRRALSIATRYALQRRQFSAPGHEGQVLLIDYLAHQRKLLPRIAEAYALMFAQNEIVDRLQELHAADNADQEAQRELETRAAGLKAVSTRFGNDTAQLCREACGGAGYLAENGLTLVRRDADVFATFEGDNTVLLQLVAKGLLSHYKEMFGDLDMFGMLQFAARSFGGAVIERTAARPVIDRLVEATRLGSGGDPLHDRGWHVEMFEDRERHVLETLATRLRRSAKSSDDSFEAFNYAQDHVLLAARVHMDRVVLEAFVQGIEDCVDPVAQDRLTRLADLYALSSIEADSAWFQQHNRLSATRSKAVTAAINELCRSLRPDALALVEGMGVPQEWLNSSMLVEPHWTP
ncbi:MAG TPA: acyl-CoA dehydrogenase [Ornithinimicrobium sp.]|uniref:acyl-CoA dehydrogenase family protein n=1 Tax=Ornithinimicrobium sp. TaxID=1977084 RepID=UPI002B45CB72|nr:acyl-CoA dehydrogenase [Ornithinimicrobium sp.]HKJ11326.1 acyl-CoA dehydrogenase [Ornithinimicrobium sp.]